MFLIQRWDNVIRDRALELENAMTLAEKASNAEPNQRIDIIEHWLERSADELIASYRNGHPIPIN